MMKRLALAAVAALFLAGCTAETDSNGNVQPDDITPLTTVFTVNLPDGGTTTCVFSKVGYGGGLDCDFDGPR